MGEWELTNEIRSKVEHIIIEYINVLENKNPEKDEGLGLSSTGINPLQVRDLLEELGYEDDGLDTNGWQHDYWWYFTHQEKKNKAKKLCICGCAMCHNIILRSE